MNFYYPNISKAAIINTGHMWEEAVYNRMTNIPAMQKWINNPPLVALLASPTDAHNKEMQRDKLLIDKLG